jgi:hypothetical protein
MKRPHNLAEIQELYFSHIQTKYPRKKTEEIINQTKTAIDRFTLPGFGFSPFKGRKATQKEIAEAVSFKQSISLEQLEDVKGAQKIGFGLLQASNNSKYVYGCALSKLLDWCSGQDWHPSNKNKHFVRRDRCPSRRRKGFGCIKNTPLIDSRPTNVYGLQQKQITPILQVELNLYYDFRTRTHWPGRLEKPIKLKPGKHQVSMILHMLGWFYNYEKVPLEKLSLELLIPKVQLKYVQSLDAARMEASKAGEYVDDWVCRFFNFLEYERNAKSPHSRKNYLCVLLAVAKLQYLKESSDSKFRDIPAIDVLRQRLSLATAELKHHEPVADLDKKWLELPDVLSKVVEPLRHECKPRISDGTPRSEQALMSSVQVYLLWGCLTYAPPRRQQELRQLKMAMICPIERNVNIAPGHFIHPLPPANQRDKNCGYLHKTVDGKWIKDMTAESYKTGETYGHQQLEIPNVNFPDGSCFYDYLEMWLYGYYKAADGSLKSCGTSFEPDRHQISHWYKGRMVYEPSHDFVFTKKNGQPFETDEMAKYTSGAAHAQTGKRLTPHLLRDIYVTYFLDRGYSDAEISSLAYSLGHSLSILRKIYDRRHPAQKHRPIEQAVLDIVQKFLEE